MKPKRLKEHSFKNLKYKHHYGNITLNRPRPEFEDKYTLTIGSLSSDPGYKELVIEVWKGKQRIGEAYFTLDPTTGKPIIYIEPNGEMFHTIQVSFDELVNIKEDKNGI